MNILRIFSVFITIILVNSCFPHISDRLPKDDGEIKIAIVQMNDVYEISGVSGGTKGNLARVQGFYDGIQEEYPNSMLLLAGDFLNPSLINTMKYEGSRIKGKQMVETLNAMDVDLVAFGNHEFDLNMDDLQKRMDESDFPWIATNLQQVCGNTTYPFYKTVDGKKQFAPETYSRTFVDDDGTSVDIGIFSAIINSNPKSFVEYWDADSCSHLAIETLNEEHEIIIGLTHLDIINDKLLAKNESNVDLILGGHDHDNMYFEINNTVITKADANAKTVYLHILHYDVNQDLLMIDSKLVPIDANTNSNEHVQKVIDKWDMILSKNIKTIVDNPYEIVYHAAIPLDGRESSIRHHQTNLGLLAAKAMLETSQHGAIAGILNSGGIRIDDQLSGDITGVDIFRIMPFGGSIYDVNLKGSLLKGILRYSENNKGKGAYLQFANIEHLDGHWIINGNPINDAIYYPLVMNDFLLMGYDIPFLTEENTGIQSIDKPRGQNDPRQDIRVALINYLKRI